MDSAKRDCPICGRDIVKKSWPLYGVPVCKRCAYGFAGLRRTAYILDSIFIIVGLLIAFLPFILVTALLLQAMGLDELDVDEIIGEVLVPLYVFILTPLLFIFKDGFSGYSLGKRLTGLRVRDEAGRPIGVGKSFLRNLPVVLFFPYVTLIALFQLHQGKRIGDGWAKTRVVWEKYRLRPPFESSQDDR